MRRDEALRRLAEHREELAAMGAGSLSLFGSVARDEAGPDSDVDILIELNRQLDLFDLGGIQVRLEEIMGCTDGRGLFAGLVAHLDRAA